MKKLSLVLLLMSIVAVPAWAGGPKKPQGSGPKIPALQKLSGLNLGGRGSQSSPSVGGAIGSDFEPGKLTRPTVVDHR